MEDQNLYCGLCGGALECGAWHLPDECLTPWGPMEPPLLDPRRYDKYDKYKNINIFDSDVEEYESLDEFIGVKPFLKAFPRPSRIEEEECPICFSFISSKGNS